jgi:hypothetical protein
VSRSETRPGSTLQVNVTVVKLMARSCTPLHQAVEDRDYSVSWDFNASMLECALSNTGRYLFLCLMVRYSGCEIPSANHDTPKSGSGHLQHPSTSLAINRRKAHRIRPSRKAYRLSGPAISKLSAVSHPPNRTTAPLCL